MSRPSIYLDLADARFVYLPASGHEGARTNLHTGDILVSVTADIGIIGWIDKSVPQPAYINQHIALVRFDPQKVHSQFVAYFLANYPSQRWFRAITDQGAKAGINLETIRKLTLVTPPSLTEQEAIAEALSDADALIESLEQLLAKKRDIKHGAMQELLTGKKRLPGFNGKWRRLPIGECFNISGGLSASRDQLSHDGHCYLHYGDIHGSSKSFIDVDAELQDIPRLNVPPSAVSPSSLLGDGDVVFVDASEDVDGTSRHVVITNPRNIPFISGLHTIVAKPKGNDLIPLYCRYCFHTDAVKAQFRFFAVGTKVSGVSKTNIAKIEVAVPEPKEQIAIAEILIDIDAEIAAIETKVTKARQIKQGMMQELLTGRIRLV
jgi:type I restriction enzyme S subunit